MLTFEIIPSDSTVKEYAIYYNPILDGVYVDLDNSVSIDDCQDVIGHVGLSPEFYFYDNFLSKLLIEFPTREDIYSLSLNESSIIQDLISSKSVKCNIKALTIPKMNETSTLVTDLLVSISQGFLVFFFDNYDPNLSVSIITSDDILIVELNESVVIGINRSDKTLYFIYLVNYLEKLSYTDFSIVSTDLGKERFDSLKKIIEKSIDFSLGEANYIQLITRHQELFKDKILNDRLNKAEERMIDSLKKKYIFHKS